MTHMNFVYQNEILSSVPIMNLANPVSETLKSTKFPSNLIHTPMQTPHYVYASDPMVSLEFAHYKGTNAFVASSFFKNNENLHWYNTSFKQHHSMKLTQFSDLPSYLSDDLDKNVGMDIKKKHLNSIFSSDLSQNDMDDDKSNLSTCSMIKDIEDVKKSDVSNCDMNVHSDKIWYQSKESNIYLYDEYINRSDNENYQELPDQDFNNMSKISDDVTQIPIIPPSKCVMPDSLMRYYNIYQRLDSPMTASKPQFIQTFAQNGEISLENVWKAHMKLLFRNVCHRWILHSIDLSKIYDSSYLCYKDFAKVRFYCSQCKDGWTSMCGVVLFFYRCNDATNAGDIYFQILGQKCGQCNPDYFEMPIWYPEEVQKVITNLYYDVASRVYGLKTPLPIKSRRMGQPVNHHNASLCQGCHQGFCRLGNQQSMVNNIQSVDGNKYASVSSTYFNMPCSQTVPLLVPSFNLSQGTYAEYNGFSPYHPYPPSPYVACAPHSEGLPPMVLYYPCSAY